MGRRRIGWVFAGALLFPWLFSLGCMWYAGRTGSAAGAEAGPAPAEESRHQEGQQEEGQQEESRSQAGGGEIASRRIIMEQNGRKTYLELEDYLPGVVACQIPEEKETVYSPETWKCQAVIARTYLYRLMGSREEILESELDLDYLGDYTRGIFADREAAVERLSLAETAAQETRGQVMVYDNACILPLFHEESAGRTRQGDGQFPYLQAVDSDRDGETREYSWDAGEFANRIGQIPGAVPVEPDQLAGQIQTVARDDSGYLLEVQIGAKTYSGDEVQTALGLPSAYFRLEAGNGQVRAAVRGRGHGYGFSQNGGDQMAKNGWGYEDILFYYFKNIDLVFE